MPISTESVKILHVGFRFQKTFRLTDITGQIFDMVLQDPSSPFDTKFFTRLEEVGNHDKLLDNPSTGCFLRITSSDIIFRHAFLNQEVDFKREFDWFKDDAIPFIVDKIIGDYKIRNVMRIGIMYTNIIEAANIGGLVLSKLTSDSPYNIAEADQFSLNFGKKDPTAEGFIKSGVDDYVNKITMIKQISSTNYDVTLDYQYYFVPPINVLNDFNITNFVDNSYGYLTGSFYKIIQTLVPEEVTAI